VADPSGRARLSLIDPTLAVRAFADLDDAPSGASSFAPCARCDAPADASGFRSIEVQNGAATDCRAHDPHPDDPSRPDVETTMAPITRRLLAAALAVAACGVALGQASAPPTMRVRGTVESFDGTTLQVRDRSGASVGYALADNFAVSEVLPIELASIQPGSYIGTAAMPNPDGTLGALAITVFPETARGVAEGHSSWDLQPGSTMTNGTVGDVVVAPARGRTLKLRYKDGEKTVVVPDGTAIVTFKPADRSLLVPGAKVTVTAQVREGRPTALRVQAGRNGFMPPT
jgi:hypothetical protein